MSVDVDEVREELVMTVTDKSITVQHRRKAALKWCMSHADALLAEVVALQKEELLYQCKLKALGQRVVQERDKRESLRTRLDRAVAALTEKGKFYDDLKTSVQLAAVMDALEVVLRAWCKALDKPWGYWREKEIGDGDASG